MKKESFALRLRAWFNNLPIPDQVERRMASLLQGILIGLITLILFATIVLMATPSLDTKEKLDGLKGNFFGLLVVTLPLSLLRRGYFRSSALIIITILVITPALAIIFVFDLPNSAGILIQFTLAIILAGLLVSRHTLALVFGLSAALVAFSAFQGQSAEPRLARLSMATAINFILFNGLITVFLDQFGITLRTALTDALARETELQSEITDRKQAEAVFQESEEKYRKLFESIDQGFCTIEVLFDKDEKPVDYRFLIVNPAFERQTGIPNAVGRRMREIAPLHEEHWFRIYGEIALTGKSMRFENPAKQLQRYYEVYAWKVGTLEERQVAILFNDITERKRAEEEIRKLNEELEQRVVERTAALSQANSLLQMMLENVPDQIYFKDAQSRFIRNSRSQAKALGLSDSAEAVGKSDFDFFPHAQLSFEKEQEIIRSGKPLVDEEEHVVWPDGRETWVSTTKVPLPDQNGRIIGTFGISRDITDRKRSEIALQKAKLELEAANKELEAFSYSVSHDLRSPLRTIDGFSQALLEDYADQLPTEGQDHLKRVRAATQRMGQLIDDLLELSKVTRAPMKLVPVDLSELAQNIGAELQRTQPERQVNFNFTPNLKARGDPSLLQAVFENLLNNAWKFTSRREQAEIEFGSETENDETIYFIRDNGAGFDMTYVGKLFGAFQRLHAMTEFSGTGIGLATVQRIINRHGGRIWAEGAVDQGATFFFTLPALERAKPEAVPLEKDTLASRVKEII